jgi:50S ribosomal protein L16 3-hydroxylase
MDLDQPCTLLGGLSPQRFMRTHWQRKPLLVRQALPGVTAPLSRADLFELAGREDVESRLVVRRREALAQVGGKAGAKASGTGPGEDWTLRRGPQPRRALPPLKQPDWTLLVQGLDLHVPAARALLERFRFVPDARLDDLMISYATDGGGVGPHLDAYDVFLIQVHGRRRWRISRVADEAFVERLPLRILQDFEPEQEWLLEPGDMLYLPPRWAHDGVAEGECMTCSVGFRAPARQTLAADLLARLADAAAEEADASDDFSPGAVRAVRFRDAGQPATAQPARVPDALLDFARDAIERALRDPNALARAVGESLSEPKPEVVFESGASPRAGQGLRLADRTRMLYDERHVYINGESFRAGGRDAALMRQLADQRCLTASQWNRLSAGARELVAGWAEAGWAVPLEA